MWGESDEHRSCDKDDSTWVRVVHVRPVDGFVVPLLFFVCSFFLFSPLTRLRV